MLSPQPRGFRRGVQGKVFMPLVASVFDFALTTTDLVVMAIYLAATIAFGISKSRRAGAEDYFLGGRGMTWPVIGLSMLAMCVSSSSLVGWAGDAYSTGISVFNYGISGAIIVLVFFLWFFLPFYLRSGVYTMPEFLEGRYDARSRWYFSFITVVGYTFLDSAVTLYAGARMMQAVFPNMPLEWLIGGLALVSASYTIVGGLSAVMWVDLVQSVMLLVGSTILTWIAFAKAGGWNAVMASVPPENLSLIRPATDPSVPWPTLIITLPLLGFYFWCTSQAMVQRTLSARSVNEARWGNLFAGLLNFAVFFVMVLPGVAGRVLYPGLERGDLIYPKLVFELMPPGIKGVVVVGFVAAMISTLSSILNSAATLVTMDFVRKFRPDLTSRGQVIAGNVAGFVIAIIAALWAPEVQKFESVVKYFQQFLGYLAPPIVAVFLFGLFWPRATGSGAFAALIAGLAMAGWMIGSGGRLPPFTDWHPFLYVPPVIFLLASAVLVAVSLATPAPDPTRISRFLWNRSILHDESADLAALPWWQNYRTLSILLLAFTAGFVWIWR
jgi:SSS family solute:Na+ symporter